MENKVMTLRILIIIFCCHPAVFVSGQNEGRAEEMCRQFSDLYMRQCSHLDQHTTSDRRSLRGFPGKRGNIGPIGPSGAAGPPGPQGVVDHKQFDRKIDAVKLELKAEFENKLLQMEKKMNSTISQMFETAARCELRHEGKCFLAIIHHTQDVDLAVAKSMCNDIGWGMANIHSRTHYDLVASYLRTKPTSSDYIAAWLGMTYDAKRSIGERVMLSNRSRSENDLPWYPGYPSSTINSDKMNIVIRRSLSSKKQGMVNLSDSHRRNGVIWEISDNTILP